MSDKAFDFFEKNPVKCMLSGVVAFFMVIFAIAYVGAMFEAKAYSNYCDTPVTTWDALFLDLRIDECQCAE